MRTRTLAALSTLVLSASLLAGCGGGSSSSSDSYCKELKAAKADFSSLGSGSADFSKFDEVIATFHKLSGDAPSEVKSEWKTLDGAITTLENALKDAGIKPSDLAAMQNGQLPKGVDMAKLQALAPKLQALNSSDVSTAADKIAADAKKNCNVDLNAS